MGLSLLVDGLKVFSDHFEEFRISEQIFLAGWVWNVRGFFVQDRPRISLRIKGSEPL